MALLEAVVPHCSSSGISGIAVKYLDLGGNAITDAGENLPFSFRVVAMISCETGVSSVVEHMRRAHSERDAAVSSVGPPARWHSLETLEIVANEFSEISEAALRQLIDEGYHCGVDIVFQKRAGPGEA